MAAGRRPPPRAAAPPDMHLRVSRVLHTSRHAEGFRGLEPALRTALVRGHTRRPLKRTGRAAFPDLDAPLAGCGEEEDVCVMLNFAARGAGGVGRDGEGELCAGAEVLVWGPWFEVPVAPPTLLVGDPGYEAREEVARRTLGIMEEMPLPSPLGSAPRREVDEGEEKPVRKALMCERFIIMREER